MWGSLVGACVFIFHRERHHMSYTLQHAEIETSPVRLALSSSCSRVALPDSGVAWATARAQNVMLGTRFSTRFLTIFMPRPRSR